ncbi:MAG: biopolymer transporter ExbD [Desulfobacteraceae bacterium]|nr:MAG: biopolymer transporter ExbD [Desulfobacteraceae bacterium]
MTIYKNKRSPYPIQAPLTSLIDIVFLLLIYFLLTTNFLVEEGIKIKLPNARAAAPQTRQEITVSLNRHGAVFLQNQKIPVDQLYSALKTMIAGQQDRLVVVKADKTIVLNKAVKVMDIAKAAGAGRLCLATEKGL